MKNISFWHTVWPSFCGYDLSPLNCDFCMLLHCTNAPPSPTHTHTQTIITITAAAATITYLVQCHCLLTSVTSDSNVSLITFLVLSISMSISSNVKPSVEISGRAWIIILPIMTTTNKTIIINDDHENNNCTKNINNFNNAGGNALKNDLSNDIRNKNCKRWWRHINSLYEYLNGLLLLFKFALWLFSPVPFNWKLRDRKI